MRNKSAAPYTINAGSMGADITGSLLDARGAHGCYLDASWTGTSPLGTLFLESTPVEAGTPRILYEWPISGNAGSETLDYTKFNGGFIRARFARTSGTGSLSVQINLKE